MKTSLMALLLLASGCSSLNRQPSSVEDKGSPKGFAKFVYFGDDNDTSHFKFEHVKNGIKTFTQILKRDCDITLEYTLEEREPISFNRIIEYPLSPMVVETPQGHFPFIYNQESLYEEFKDLGINKKKNEIYIIKTDKMGLNGESGGRPVAMCGSANPDVQLDKSLPENIRTQIRNSILFNVIQKNCPQNFNFVIAHEIGHLFVQDNPAHSVADDIGLTFAAPPENLMGLSGGLLLNRKYQCPKIEKTIADFFSGGRNE